MTTWCLYVLILAHFWEIMMMSWRKVGRRCSGWNVLSPRRAHRSVPREQTDLESAPRTAASRGLASDHGEGTSRPGHATTAATRHPEAEDGPLGEPHANTLHWPPLWGDTLHLYAREGSWRRRCSPEVVSLLHYSKVQCVKFDLDSHFCIAEIVKCLLADQDIWFFYHLYMNKNMERWRD